MSDTTRFNTVGFNDIFQQTEGKINSLKIRGADGPTGDIGNTGAIGDVGTAKGNQGPQGPAGSKGPNSIIVGPVGPDSSVTGPIGPVGYIGPTGSITGPTGPADTSKILYMVAGDSITGGNLPCPVRVSNEASGPVLRKLASNPIVIGAPSTQQNPLTVAGNTADITKTSDMYDTVNDVRGLGPFFPTCCADAINLTYFIMTYTDNTSPANGPLVNKIVIGNVQSNQTITYSAPFSYLGFNAINYNPIFIKVAEDKATVIVGYNNSNVVVIYKLSFDVNGVPSIASSHDFTVTSANALVPFTTIKTTSTCTSYTSKFYIATPGGAGINNSLIMIDPTPLPVTPISTPIDISEESTITPKGLTGKLLIKYLQYNTIDVLPMFSLMYNNNALTTNYLGNSAKLDEVLVFEINNINTVVNKKKIIIEPFVNSAQGNSHNSLFDINLISRTRLMVSFIETIAASTYRHTIRYINWVDGSLGTATLSLSAPNNTVAGLLSINGDIYDTSLIPNTSICMYIYNSGPLGSANIVSSFITVNSDNNIIKDYLSPTIDVTTTGSLKYGPITYSSPPYTSSSADIQANNVHNSLVALNANNYVFVNPAGVVTGKMNVPATISLDLTSYIGVLTSSVSAGSIGKVSLIGGITEYPNAWTSGQLLYLDSITNKGFITTSSVGNVNKAGIAINSTNILISKLA